MDSCRISFFNLLSISSRFSALSDMERVFRGSEASRKTNERPEMYTEPILVPFLYSVEVVLTYGFFSCREPYAAL